MNGIAILGLNGGGKSTLAHVLAKKIGYFEMDVEDYYFPEQSTSRKWSLDNHSIIETEYLGELPFSNPRNTNEVQSAILKDIEENSQFILAGVTMNWNEEILSKIDIAFVVQTPVEERLRRLQMREEKRFGMRVLVGGDMYEQQKKFREVVKEKDLKAVEEGVNRLKCPVVVLDGMKTVEDNLEKIMSKLKI